MFPDSSITKGFTYGTRYSYSFGVAPCMKDILDDIVISLDTSVALFDESFDKSTKKVKSVYIFTFETRKVL